MPETGDGRCRYGDCKRGKCRRFRNRTESDTTSDEALRSSVIIAEEQGREAWNKPLESDTTAERNSTCRRAQRDAETTANTQNTQSTVTTAETSADTKNAPSAVTTAETTTDTQNVPSAVTTANTAAETRGSDNAGSTAPTLSSKPHHWYCKNNDKHARPPLPSEFRFITKHGGYWIGKEDSGKVIYLTFDAGYENGNVAKILDILKEKKVPGAFFILENFVRRNPELVIRMANEGHLVCNHTSHHKDMSILSESEFTEELTSLERAVKEHAGVKLAKYYRPPCGTLSERDLALANKLGYKTVMWSYAYADWDNNAQPIPDKALEKLLGHTHEGMVLLLHPTSATNAQILDDFIDRMLADGWRFGTLTEFTAS